MKYRYDAYSKLLGKWQINLSYNLGDDTWTGSINQYGIGFFIIKYPGHVSLHFHLCGIRLRCDAEWFIHKGL